MTKQDRNVLDDLVEIGRDIIERIDEALNPERKVRRPARIPIPVDPKPAPRPRDDERHRY